MNLISLTTTEARIRRLRPTLETIAAQTRKPDSVMLHAVESLGPRYVDEVDDLLEDGLITHFISFEDRGPVTKLAILESRLVTDDDLIVTIDDDILYQPTWLETLVAAAEKHPNEAVGFTGWNVADFLRAQQENDPKGGTYVWAGVGACDVLEGWAGIAYRRRFFYIDPIQGFASVLHPLPMFRNVDDVWISWHLHRRGFGRRVIGNRLASERMDNTPGLHHRDDFVDLNRQAALFSFGNNEP